MTEPPSTGPTPHGHLRLLRAAAAACLVEAAALVVLAVVEVASMSSDSVVVGGTTTAFFVVYAVGLALAARGLARARSWARAPLMLTQLIALGVAWSFFGPGTRWVSILLALLAVFVIVVLLMPATTVALYGDRARPDTHSGRPPKSRRTGRGRPS